MFALIMIIILLFLYSVVTTTCLILEERLVRSLSYSFKKESKNNLQLSLLCRDLVYGVATEEDYLSYYGERKTEETVEEEQEPYQLTLGVE